MTLSRRYEQREIQKRHQFFEQINGITDKIVCTECTNTYPIILLYNNIRADSCGDRYLRETSSAYDARRTRTKYTV